MLTLVYLSYIHIIFTLGGVTMYFALDNEGIRTGIEQATDREYYCPVCNQLVIKKKGHVNAWHYAHKTTIECDKWYQVNEWKQAWQRMFREQFREVIVSNEGEKHRADIKIGKLVVQFEKGTIQGNEFDNRNIFFMGNNNHLVWVFDVKDKDITERTWAKGITVSYVWKWAYKFNNLDVYGSRFDLFLQIEDDLLVKVIWNKQGFKYFGGYKYSQKQFMEYLRYRYKKLNKIKS